VVVIVFMPYGLVPGCRQLWQRLATRVSGRGTKGAGATAPGRAQ